MKYDPSVWKSVSNKYRTIARLPEGKTGLEALRDVAPDEAASLERRIEQWAADTYRRIYASRHGDAVELSVEDYQVFRKAGGKSSF